MVWSWMDSCHLAPVGHPGGGGWKRITRLGLAVVIGLALILAVWPAAADGATPPGQALQHALEQVETALKLAEQGELGKSLAVLEQAQRVAAPALDADRAPAQSEAVEAVRNHFAITQVLIAGGAPPQAIAQAGSNLRQALERCRDVLTTVPRGDALTLFGYALLIVVREGTEALLVVSALAAAAQRCGVVGWGSVIGWAVIGALGASLSTAALLSWLLYRLPTVGEILQGVVLVLAGLTLFAVGNGFLLRADAGKVGRGTAGAGDFASSALGLGLTAFLAVYREGAETVLFYSALAADSTRSGLLGLMGGFLSGVLLLAGLVLLLRHNVSRLPLGLFLRLSGWLMLIMAFTFTGQAVMALYEGFEIPATPVTRLPEIQALGLYPYLEPLIAQGLMLVAVVVARWFRGQAPSVFRPCHRGGNLP